MKQFTKGHIVGIVIIVLLWIVLEAIFFAIASEAEEEYEKDLIKQANFYNQDIQNIRNWNLKLGGIYAFADKIETNIDAQDDTLETNKGDLIRINPGWMTRLLSQNSQQDILQYALVSNKPINTNNQAKGFYAKKLTELEKTNSEEVIYEIDKLDKRLRYMQPIYTVQSCMDCHIETSYEVGEIRGAMVIDMDASFTLDRTAKVWQNFYFVSIFTTLFVLLGLLFIRNLSGQKMRYLTKNIELEETLKQKLIQLNQVLTASEIGYWEWNVQTNEHNVDTQWLKILGLDESNANKNSNEWMKSVHSDDLERIMPIIENAIAHKKPYSVEFRMRHADGSYVWIQGSGGVTSLDENGNALKASGTHQDITKRKLLEIQQQNNAGYLSTLFEQNPNIIIVTDGKNITKANHAFFRFFDEYKSLEEFTQEHRCICEFFQHSESDGFITNEPKTWVEDVMSSNEPIAKIRYKEQDYCFAVHAKKVYDNGFLKVIVTFNNITETFALKKRFEELSIVDELTKIHNRRHFNRVFEEEVNRAKRENNNFCFMIMDIDNFKLYNDNYGHAEGDKVLAHFAQELKSITKRSNEFSFRLGGEEFGVIFNPESMNEALEYAEKIRKHTYMLNIEHNYNLPSKRFTISIGVVYKEAGEKLDLAFLYKQADQALYEAKAKARNRVEIFKD